VENRCAQQGRPARSLWRRARGTFLSGLVVIVPVGLTGYVLWLLYLLVDGMVGKSTPFGRLVERVLGTWIPGLGIYLTIAVVFLVGFLARNVLGRFLQRYLDRFFAFFPAVRTLYAATRQLTKAVLERETTTSFQKVVLFEYPSPGTHVLGLVASEEAVPLADGAEEGLVVYVPNAPNPFSGRMMVVARRKLAYVDVSVEDALAMVVSTGSVVPDALRAARLTEKAPRVSPVGGH